MICSGLPQKYGTTILHPLYLYVVDLIRYKINKKIKTACPAPIHITKEYEILDVIPYADTCAIKYNEYFDLKVFLFSIYNIRTINDAIEWGRYNLKITSEHTIDRVFDATWETLITIDDIDKLVLFYQEYIKGLHDVDTNYKDMYDILNNIAKKYLGTNLTKDSKKSFQKKIKKSLNINIT